MIKTPNAASPDGWFKTKSIVTGRKKIEIGATPPSIDTALGRKEGRDIASQTRIAGTTIWMASATKTTVSLSMFESHIANGHVILHLNTNGRIGSRADNFNASDTSTQDVVYPMRKMTAVGKANSSTVFSTIMRPSTASETRAAVFTSNIEYSNFDKPSSSKNLRNFEFTLKINYRLLQVISRSFVLAEYFHATVRFRA